MQYGGRHHAPAERFRFTAVKVESRRLEEGHFEVSTRRGKQFNSLVYASRDPLNGADRDHVLMDPADAAALGLGEDDPIVLSSETGDMAGRVRFARLPRQTLQVHWPEGNVLLGSGPAHREPRSKVPDYTAVVTVARASTD